MGYHHNHNPYPPGFGKVDLPEAQLGGFCIERTTVKDDGHTLLENLRSLRDGMPERVVPPGQYTRLVYRPKAKEAKAGGRGRLLMSDTPFEAWSNRPALQAAEGHMLINGLGLGFLLKAILRKPGVARVTVIEKERDVIELVGSHYRDDRLEIIHADAFEYQPPKGIRYNLVWHDIWDEVSVTNLAEIKQLKLKYGRRCAWQGAWAQREILRLQARGWF